VKKIVAASLLFFLCVLSFAIGHAIAMRAGASMVLDNTKMIAIWRESDWAVSSIRYAKMIKLIEAQKYDAAMDQACQAIAKDLKNIRTMAANTDPSSHAKVPMFSEQTYASSCK
jgi:hypothetical protein